MSSPFLVRRATPADKAVVCAVAEAAMPGDWVPDSYDDMMKTTPPVGLYVAEQDGRVIACFELNFPGPGEAFFGAMRVDPAVQGQGIGSRFCQEQVELARSLGARNIYLLSLLDNYRAHRTVEKNGFANLGPWTIFYDLKVTAPPAAPVRARPVTAADAALVERFLAERAGEPLANVICDRNSAWQMKTLAPTDWEQDHVVVVAGPDRLEGLMLYSFSDWNQLLVRRLEGSPEAAADLLNYALTVAQREGYPEWSVSLPARLEHLVQPLGVPEAQSYRAFVFCCHTETPRQD